MATMSIIRRDFENRDAGKIKAGFASGSLRVILPISKPCPNPVGAVGER
jgi:hypothetical protein